MAMIEEGSVLAHLQDQVRQHGKVEAPVVHQVEPSFRTPSQVAFNPALVAKIVEQTADKE